MDFIGFAAVLIRLISFFCLNLNVMTEVDTRRKGYFALGWLSVSIVLLALGFVLLSDNEILSRLDPYSSFFTGLAYIFFWFVWAIEAAVELLIALIQSLIRARRDTRHTINPLND